MPDSDWVWYDTALFAVAAGTEHHLFQIAKGTDAAHQERDTNMNGAGQFPSTEKFLCKKIGVSIDFETDVYGDYADWFINGLLEFRIGESTVYVAPLKNFVELSAWSGHFEVAAAAAEQAIGLIGDGYTFDKQVMIPGGVHFDVRIVQGFAMSAASLKVKCQLYGTRTQ